jgi:hypothetical protein
LEELDPRDLGRGDDARDLEILGEAVEDSDEFSARGAGIAREEAVDVEGRLRRLGRRPLIEPGEDVGVPPAYRAR